MRVPRWPLPLLFFTALILMPISNATAQERLDKCVQSVLGTDKAQRYSSQLLELSNQMMREGTEARTISSARVINVYVALARSAKTDQQVKALDELRPRFAEALSSFFKTVSDTAAQLEKTDVGQDLPYIYGQIAKMEPGCEADFLAYEILLSYGTSPERLLEILRATKSLGADGIRQMKEATVVIDKLKSAALKDIASSAEGIKDMVDGGILVVIDIGAIRKAPLRSIISIPTGVEQFVEGWKKLFG